MKGIDLIAPTLERSAVVQETLRIFEVCDGCRRCFNLCPSFNTLFERIDAGDSDLSKLASRDFEQVADECYYCKLCYNHCPYTPPHQYEIDFPRLMVGWKKLQAQEGKARWRDRLLVRTDWVANSARSWPRSRTGPTPNRGFAGSCTGSSAFIATGSW